MIIVHLIASKTKVTQHYSVFSTKNKRMFAFTQKLKQINLNSPSNQSSFMFLRFVCIVRDAMPGYLYIPFLSLVLSLILFTRFFLEWQNIMTVFVFDLSSWIRSLTSVWWNKIKIIRKQWSNHIFALSRKKPSM